MRILLVEDSATLRYAMSTYITDAGHTPVVAQSGEEALQLLEMTPIDMIIMDVEMPGLNGFETTRLIREWLGTHWIPIIFVTGLNDDASYREGIDAGGDDYLIKPVSAAIIQAKIRAMERITEMRDQLNRLNADLATLSQIDSLTQIYNRRTFTDLAQQHWAHTRRQRQPMSVLMIDVDHFKLYNDHYGHPEGDACLKQVARCIQESLPRETDIVGRYGGEEFVVLLPNTDLAGGQAVAKRIQQHVQQLGIAHEKSPTFTSVTVSIGGVTCVKATHHTLDDLIKNADRALYRVKHTARNRTLIHELATHKTLLIAHENKSESDRLTSLLQDKFNLLHCESSLECIELAQSLRPDLVLMSRHVAEQDNLAACHILTQLPQTKHVPIVLTQQPEQLRREKLTNIKFVLPDERDNDLLINKIAELVE